MIARQRPAGTMGCRRPAARAGIAALLACFVFTLQGWGAPGRGQPVLAATAAPAAGYHGAARRAAGYRQPDVSCPLPAAAAPAGPFPRTVRVGYAPDEILAGQTHAFTIATGPINVSDAYDCRGIAAMFNLRTGALVRTIQLGIGPKGAVISPSLGRLLVPNQGNEESPKRTNAEGSVSVIDTQTGDLVATTQLGQIPEHIWLSEATGLAFIEAVNVSSNGTDASFILNARTGRVVKALPISHAYDVWMDPATGEFVVSTELGVTQVDGHTGSIIRSFPAGPGSYEGCNGGTFFFDEPTRRLLLIHKGVCVIDTVAGKVARSVKAACPGFFHPQAADRHLFFDEGGDKTADGQFCLLNLDTFKADHREGDNGGYVEVEGIIPQLHIFIAGEHGCFTCDGEVYARSTVTGRQLSQAPGSYDDVTVDPTSRRAYIQSGHTIRAYDVSGWKQLFATKTSASLSGWGVLVPAAHRLLYRGGQDPKGGVVTTFCTDSPCK